MIIRIKQNIVCAAVWFSMDDIESSFSSCEELFSIFFCFGAYLAAHIELSYQQRFVNIPKISKWQIHFLACLISIASI